MREASDVFAPAYTLPSETTAETITGGGRRFRFFSSAAGSSHAIPLVVANHSFPSEASATDGSGNFSPESPGRPSSSSKCSAGNRGTRVAEPPLQLGGRDMGNARESVRPQVAGLRLHDTGHPAGQFVIFPSAS